MFNIDKKMQDKLKFHLLRSDGRIIVQRIKENYLKSNGLLEYILNATPDDFETLYEKVRVLLNDGDGGYCEYCGKRTILANKQPLGFAKYHKECYRNHVVKYKNKERGVDVDTKEIIRLYVDDKLSIPQIYNMDISIDRNSGNRISYPTIKKIIGDNMRNMSEAQANYIDGGLYNENPLNLPVNEIVDDYINNNISVAELANKHDCDVKTIRDWVRRSGNEIRVVKRSDAETTIANILDDYNISYDTNVRGVISPYELDLYIPYYKLAIEVNGVYWHSLKDKNYHKMKYDMCKDVGITLLQFTDMEIIYKKSIVKSMILNKLRLNDYSIYARNTKVKQIDTKQAFNFLEENHISGYNSSTLKYGLFYNDELLSVMTFSKPRFNKNYEWEIIRSATKQGYNVIGGVSKMITNFIRDNNVKSIISYCDYNYNNGISYIKCGFEHICDTKPNYTYYKNGSFLSRYQCQKHKLKDMFPNIYDDALTEYEIMKKANYFRIYNSGNGVFVWTSK